MDSNSGGYAGVKIDYGGVSPSEALLQGAAMNSREKERKQQLALQQARLQQEQAKQQQEDDDKKYAWAQNATDPTKQMSGQAAIDQHAVSTLGETMQQMVDDIHNNHLDMGQLMMKYQPVIQTVAQGHLVAKQQLENAYKQIDDASKDNPNINTAALRQYAVTQVGQSVLDGNGQYRTADQIDPNRDIVGAALNSPDAWKFSLGGSGLVDDLRKMQGDKVNAITQQPNGTIITHEGNITPFQQQDWNVLGNGYANKLPQFSIKSQPITLPNGQVAQALSPDVFDTQFGSAASKAKQMQFEALWNHYKENAGLKTTPQSEEYAKRMYAYQLVKDNVQNQMQQVHAEHLPKQGNTINNINMGSNPPVYDLYNDLVHATQYDLNGNPRPHNAAPATELPQKGLDYVLAQAEKVFGKNKETQTDAYGNDKQVEKPLNASDILLKYEGNQVRVYNVSTKQSFVLDKTGVNLFANGSVKQDYKVEQEHNAAPPATTKPATTSTNTPTANKWDKYKRN